MLNNGIIIAAKCAPEEKCFSDIKKAGLNAVELYLSDKILRDTDRIINLCRDFPFTYAIHAPNEGGDLKQLFLFAKGIGARVVVLHDIYWDNEWSDIINLFKDSAVKLCVENTGDIYVPLKFMRRYNVGLCLDLEHLQMQCAGVYEEEFIRIISKALHIHLTSYSIGSALWHTHIHSSPEHGRYFLNLIYKSGYKGFVISEAKASLQTFDEFKKLKEFSVCWEKGL